MSLKKVRKEVSGAVRNKQRTRSRLLECIGKILHDETYSGLTITAVYKKARLNPKLVYLYFKDFDHLVETFVNQRLEEFQTKAQANMEVLCLDSQDYVLEAIFQQVDDLYQDEPLKKLLHWAVVDKRKKALKTLLKSFSEYFAELFDHFTATLPTAERKSMIATLDLLISGTLFLFLHATEGTRFLTLDLSNEADRARVYQTIRRLVCYSNEGMLLNTQENGILA